MTRSRNDSTATLPESLTPEQQREAKVILKALADPEFNADERCECGRFKYGSETRCSSCLIEEKIEAELDFAKQGGWYL